MPWRLRIMIALRQALDPGRGLSAFLSRISIVGMAVAIALLLAVQSVMNGFDREMRERILSLVPHVVVTGAAEAEDWPGVSQTLAEQPGVLSVRRFRSMDALLLRGREVFASRLMAVDDEAVSHYASLLQPTLTKMTERDLILGQSLALRLGLEIGDAVTLIIPGREGEDYLSISVSLRALLVSGTELDESLALTHRRALPAAESFSGGVESLAIELKDVFEAAQWRWEIMQIVPSNFRVNDWRATHGNLYSAIQLSRDLIGLILFSVIFVAAFNVVSSLMLVVTDRRKIVAMLVTMGAVSKDIVAIFFLQGAVIGAVGAVFGAGLGWILASGAPHIARLLEQLLGVPLLQTDVYPLSFIPVDMRWQDFLFTCAVAIFLSVLAASIPAVRAARLPLAETLSH
jgi:lipoprotein-releasing system permease protein